MCEREIFIILPLFFSQYFSFADVDDVKVVINYDFPNVFQDYVHRIGRTGRTDKKVRLTLKLVSHRSDILYPMLSLLQKCDSFRIVTPCVCRELRTLSSRPMMERKRAS